MNKRERYLVFGAPSLGQAEIDEVVAVLRSGWIGTGPRVGRFERDFAHFKGVEPPACSAVGSCTAALHLAMVASGVGKGDEVITTAMTFCATVNAIIHAGATPVLADIDPVTLNIDPADIRAKLSPRTRAVLPVHFAGRMCAMDEIMQIAEDRNLLVIEDCAHAIESSSRGKAAGTWGDFGCFSFYATKNITTAEGGMVLCKDEAKAGQIRSLALHGLSKDAWHRFSDAGYQHYYVEQCGYKYNMTDIQAALGIHQLASVESNLQRRAEIWSRYQEAFSGLPVVLPAEPSEDSVHARHLYTIRVSQEKCGISRDELLVKLHEWNIGTGVHYLCLAEHPFYQREFGWDSRNYPHAHEFGRETLSLPLSPAMSDDDVADVIAAVRFVLKRA